MTEPSSPLVTHVVTDVVTDVAIVGAGAAGLILALALARAGVAVAVIERAALAPPAGAPSDGPSDGRVFALSAGSRRVLEGLGLWAGLASGAAPVNDILVSDRDGPPLVRFDHADMAQGPLGHVVAAAALQRVLLDAARAQPGIGFFAPAPLDRIAATTDSARLGFATLNRDGGTLDARLVVGADGRHSMVRHAARINVTEWTYDQAAIVATVVHARPHRGVAEERFLAGGPFAVLPLPDGADGSHRSSVVWTEAAARVADLMRLGAGDFDSELGRRMGDRLGPARVVGARSTYPLALLLAESYIGHRLALIGDAAHSIHPIAGQGLNLGIRDAAALAEVIVDARRLGLDYGMKTVLLDFERWRRFDNTCLAAATDLLNRLFGIDNWAFGRLRQAGMVALNAFAPARRLFMAEAMGFNGELPRLARGEPL